jgi:hypothetical protein
MSTQDDKPKVVAAPVRLQRPKKWLPIAVVVAMVVLVVGGFGGTYWYKKYQVSQRERQYQAVVAKATNLNQQGKSTEVAALLEPYLASNPEPKYQSRPKFLLALAYLGTKKTDKAKPLLQEIINDASVSKGDKKAVLSALISIAAAENNTADGEKYLVQMLAHLDDTYKNSKDQSHGIYYVTERQRFQMILDGLRKQKK